MSRQFQRGPAPYRARSAADSPQRHRTKAACQSFIVLLKAVKLPATLAPKAVSAVALTSSAPRGPSTVLIHCGDGPGADASHGDHLHVDLQMHGSSDRYRICQ